LKGLSGGLSNDIRDLQEAAAAVIQGETGGGRPHFEARRWIGGYFLALNGVDASFSPPGSAENRSEIRAAICADLDELGIRVSTR
jgi:acetate kinase